MIPLRGLRECRATSFDQTPIGKWSRAGRLTRNAPKLSNHDCADTCVNVAPRRDIRRGPRFSTISWSPFRTFTTGGLSVSSGMDLATHVPAPTKVSKYPSASNCSYELNTVMREIFSLSAKLLVDGTRCPGRIWPPRMALQIQSYNWRYIGIFVRLSSAIGGRKLAEIRFIRDNPHMLYVERLQWLYRNRSEWLL